MALMKLLTGVICLSFVCGLSSAIGKKYRTSSPREISIYFKNDIANSTTTTALPTNSTANPMLTPNLLNTTNNMSIPRTTQTTNDMSTNTPELQWTTNTSTSDTQQTTSTSTLKTEDPSRTSNSGLIVAVCIGVGFGIVGVSCAIYFFRHKRRLQRSLEKMESSNSFQLKLQPPPTLEPTIDKETQKVINALEVPLACLQIGEKMIGKGEHGIVYKGTATGLSGQVANLDVAVKVMKRSVDPQETNMFIDEIKMMIRVGRHLNIVNILGVVLKGKVLAVLEYCMFGSLHNFLKENRPTFVSEVDLSGELTEPDKKLYPGLFPYSDYRNVIIPDAAEKRQTSVQWQLSTSDLIDYSYQISRGMEYLSSQMVIHRDLAARNVLVCSRKVVKISDFGMARFTENEYVMAKKAALPVKWMPPEAITAALFSQKSDVWSYGILLWEMFSLAQTPYSNLPFSGYIPELVAYLRGGNRLTRPDGAPKMMYELMKKCWSLWPEDRPLFTDIRTELQELVMTDEYLPLDESYEWFNKTYLTHTLKPTPSPRLS